MYPAGELRILAARKVALRTRIATERAQCVVAIARLVQPLAWIDRLWATWQRVAPFVTFGLMPLLAILGRRRLARRLGVVASLLRWWPIVTAAVRGWRAACR